MSNTPDMLRLAFASDDRATVNQHFGAAVGFVIYALDGERWQLVELAEFPPETMDVGGNENEVSAEGNACGAGVSHSQNKLPAKIAALAGCAAVYCLAAGGSAVKQLLAAGVQPIRLDDAAEIEQILKQIGAAIRDGGIPWVDKAIRRGSDAERFARMAGEAWEE